MTVDEIKKEERFDIAVECIKEANVLGLELQICDLGYFLYKGKREIWSCATSKSMSTFLWGFACGRKIK